MIAWLSIKKNRSKNRSEKLGDHKTRLHQIRPLSSPHPQPLVEIQKHKATYLSWFLIHSNTACEKYENKFPFTHITVDISTIYCVSTAYSQICVACMRRKPRRGNKHAFKRSSKTHHRFSHRHPHQSHTALFH